MATAQEYRTASAYLYGQAMQELDAGDLRQASEKLWGAVAQALKSVAERRGWRHDSHARFFAIIRSIREDVPGTELRSRFDAAQVLHINFYENWLDESDIRDRAEDVRLFIDQLEDVP